MSLQSKLLRVIQEGEVQPLGSTKTIYTDARIIAATNRDLERMVAEKEFREDLYFRLNVITIKIPPLNRRREDIPLLVDHFMNRFRLATGKNIYRITPQAMSALKNYNYPGNVRELENALEHAFVLCKQNTIEIEHLPNGIADYESTRTLPLSGAGDTPLELAEAETIRRTLKKHNDNRQQAAQDLGLHRTTLWRKMKKYGII